LHRTPETISIFIQKDAAEIPEAVDSDLEAIIPIFIFLRFC
jgi:hypothetical protein